MMYLDGSVPTIALVFLLGLVFGSFGNVLIARTPHGNDITGRSQCPKCGRTLPWHELIPLVSFIAQGRACRGCHQLIAWRYAFVEFASALLFVATSISHPVLLQYIPLTLALWLLLILTVIDLETQSVPDVLSFPFIWFSFLFAFASPWWHFPLSLQGALIGLLFFGVQWMISRGKWIGSGDLLIIVGIGLLLGKHISLTIIAVLLAYVIGAAVASVLLATGRTTRKSHIPFVPLLSVAAVIVFAAKECLLKFLFIQ